MDDLEITKQSPEEMSEKWLQGVKLLINQEFQEDIKKCYPEEFEDNLERIKTLAQ